jgi:hypothetical protein
MEYIIGFFLLIIILAIITYIANYKSIKRYVDLFDENSIIKLKNYNYIAFEIKRKRRPQRMTLNNYFVQYTECSLETEFPIPWSIIPPEDIIEVYGIENNNEKYLIYKIEWSKNIIKEVIDIVNKLNIEYDK